VPFPLESSGLTIRPLDSGDIDEFVAYRQDPDTARWQGWEPTYDREMAKKLVEGQLGWSFPPSGEYMQLGIIENGRLVGDLGVRSREDQPHTFEIGFTLAPDARGSGRATRAVSALLDLLFTERSAHRVVATVDARNNASAAVLIRNGFRHEAHRIDADWFKGEWTSVDEFALLSSEFRAER
jgi:RimJ/RimL family protein N-acetyltransferase